MRRDHQLRPAAAAALAQRDNIAFAVDRGFLEAELLHALQKIFGPDFFFIGRRRNLGDPFLFGKGRVIVGLDVLQRLHDLGIGENSLIGRLNRRCSGRRLRADLLACKADHQQHRGRGNVWCNTGSHWRLLTGSGSMSVQP